MYIISKVLYLAFCFISILCPCVLKPKDGSLEFQKLQDFNKAYQVKKIFLNI